jgi:histone acetyltransferase (RNA polymerase elongator complex component)
MRSDSITLNEIKRLRRFNCTRVQLGIQHTNNEILKINNRGESVEKTIKAIKLLKNN